MKQLDEFRDLVVGHLRSEADTLGMDDTFNPRLYTQRFEEDEGTIIQLPYEAFLDEDIRPFVLGNVLPNVLSGAHTVALARGQLVCNPLLYEDVPPEGHPSWIGHDHTRCVTVTLYTLDTVQVLYFPVILSDDGVTWTLSDAAVDGEFVFTDEWDDAIIQKIIANVASRN